MRASVVGECQTGVSLGGAAWARRALGAATCRQLCVALQLCMLQQGLVATPCCSEGEGESQGRSLTFREPDSEGRGVEGRGFEIMDVCLV
jgi:hypothetical protein